MDWSLPPINYTEPSDHINNEALSVMFSMANGLVDTVFVPFETIEPWLTQLANSDDYLQYLSENYLSLLGYSAGWITCITISILYILIIPTFLLTFCACRCCCGFCGHSNKQSYSEAKSKWRWCNFSSLFLINLLLILGAIFVFMTNNWVNEVVENVPQDASLIISTFNDYVSGTSNQVVYMTEQFNLTYSEIFTIVAAFGTTFVAPIVNQTLLVLQPTLDGFEQLPSDISGIESLLKEADTNLLNLETAQDTFTAELESVRTVFLGKSDPNSCTDTGCDDLYKIASNQLLWDVPLKWSNLQGFQELINILQAIINDYDIQALVDQTETAIDSLVQVVNDQTVEITEQLDDYLYQIDDQVQVALDEINKGAETLDDFVRELDSYTDNVENLNEYIVQFNYYRWAIGIGLTTTVLIVVVVYFIAMIFGSFSSSSTYPNQRSMFSHIGHYLLYLGSVLAGLFGCLLMILVMVFFTVGGFGQRYFCEPAQGPDYDLIVFVENATQGLAGYSLVDSLELTGLVWTPPEVLDDVTVTYILDQCERNASIWELVKLEFTEVDTLVDTLPATISNFTDQINDLVINELQPAIEEAIQTSPIDNDLEALEVYAKVLNETVNSVNATVYTYYVEELMQLTEVQIKTLITQIGLVPTAGTAVQIQSDTISALTELSTSGLDPQTQLLDIFTESLIFLQTEIGEFTNSLVGLEKELETAQNYFLYEFSQNVTDTAVEIVTSLTDQTLEFTNWLIDATENDLGQCNNIYQAYVETEALVCDEIISTVNGFWFSLGWCVALLPLSMFFAIKLSKYYKKYNKVGKQ